MKTPTIKLHFVDALCGAGKSHSAVKYSTRTKVSNKSKPIRTLYAIPSIKLGAQISTDMLVENPQRNVVFINSEETTTVVKDLLDKIKEALQSNEDITLVLTHNSLERLGEFPGKPDWELIVDEVPACDEYLGVIIPNNINLLTRWVKAVPTEYGIPGKMYQLVPHTGNTTMKNELKNRLVDHADDIILPILHAILQGRDVFVDAASWDLLEEGLLTRELPVTSMVSPKTYSGFARTIIMGADFKRTLLYKWWTTWKNVKFAEFKPISKNLLFTEYKNGERVVFTYLQKDRWSKYKRNKKISLDIKGDDIDEKETYGMRHVSLVNNFFMDELFLFALNKDAIIASQLKGIQIPVMSHGVNAFQGISNFYFGAALNRTPYHLSMLLSMGFGQIDIDWANIYGPMHQSMMRTSLRNPNATDIVNIVVPDKASALAMASFFKGYKIGMISGGLESTKSPPFDRKQYRKNLYQLEKAAAKSKLQSAENANLNDEHETALEFELAANNQLNAELSAAGAPAINISVWSSVTQQIPTEEHCTKHQLAESLVGILGDNPVDKKEGNFLINSTKYDGNGRTQSNVLYGSQCTFLDIDNGDLSVHKFEEIFKAQNLAFLTMNSFSRSKEQPNRYRAIFFLDRHVTSDQYKMVNEYLCDVLQSHGYSVGDSHKKPPHSEKPYTLNSGVDKGKLSTTSLFYLTCTNIHNPDSAFLHGFNVDTEELCETHSIDVLRIIKCMINRRPAKPIAREIPQLPNTNNVLGAGELSCMNIIASMSPGDRSYKACVVGGMAKHLSYDAKMRVRDAIVSAGCDKAAVHSYNMYSAG